MIFSYRYSGEDDETIDVHVTPLEDETETYRVTVGQEVFELSARLFHRAAFAKHGGEILLQYEGREYRLSEAGTQRRTVREQAGDLRAPITGKIIRVLVEPGAVVQAGEPLVIIEAMKMEQQITAPQDGIVDRVLCQEGEQVPAGTELVVLREPTAVPTATA